MLNKMGCEWIKTSLIQYTSACVCHASLCGSHILYRHLRTLDPLQVVEKTGWEWINRSHFLIARACHTSSMRTLDALQVVTKTGWEWINESKSSRPKWGFISTQVERGLRVQGLCMVGHIWARCDS